MTSIDDFSIQKENLSKINAVLMEMAEKISLLSLLPDLIPEMKNANLKKKV